MFTSQPIAKVRNTAKQTDDITLSSDLISEIVVLPDYAPGLLGISSLTFIDVIFYFHQSKGYDLQTHIYTGEYRGVLASRSPHRPNAIGVTSCRLLDVKNNILIVKGLDAINGTPVLDIKPSDNAIFNDQAVNKEAQQARLLANPRNEAIRQILTNQLDQLLIAAAALHGHYCPGLAMGIMAAVRAMRELNAFSDGMEDIVAITETNNCFADGVQYTTACSFGNNSLIFKDIGKTAFTLAKRNGKAIRVCSRQQAPEIIKKAFPEFDKYYQLVVGEQQRDEYTMKRYKELAIERALGTFKLPFDDLFAITKPESLTIPAYAPTHQSIICEQCRESVMASRIVEQDGQKICYPCAGITVPQLDGHGIHM